VTVRNYKSLSTAIANSFSLIRLALIIINKFVNYHVKYSIEELIIGKNFYFENSKYQPQANTNKENSLKTVKQSLTDKKPSVKLLDANKTPKISKQGRLSMKDIYLNISCWRYFI
jgi:hypothetical protein